MLGRAWEAMPEPKRQFLLQIVHPDGKVDTFHIGPHSPSLKTEDIHLVHRLWLNITREGGLDKLHHHDILTEALTRFARDYAGRDREEILKELRKTNKGSMPNRTILGDGNGGVGTKVAPRSSPPEDKKSGGPSSPPLVGP